MEAGVGVAVLAAIWVGAAWFINRMFLAPWRWLRRAGVRQFSCRRASTDRRGIFLQGTAAARSLSKATSANTLSDCSASRYAAPTLIWI